MTLKITQAHYRLKITTCLVGLVALLMLSNHTFGAFEKALAPPKWTSITEDRGTINLRWFRVQNAVEYFILRRDGETGEFKNIGRVSNPAFGDLDVRAGVFYFYKIVTVGRGGIQGTVSEVRFYQIPPTESFIQVPPDWVTHIQSPKGIALSWSHPSSKQVLAFNLYRKTRADSTFNLLTSTLNTNFRDITAKAGLTYQYVLTALDMKLQESDFSDPLTIVFSGKVADLKSNEQASSINILEEVVQLTELVTEYGWEEYGFISPTDLVYLPSDGTIYVSDTGTGYITVIGADREVLRRLGGSGPDPWHFERLLGIAVDARGYLYAADAYKGELVVFNPQGAFDGRIRLDDQVRKYFGDSLLVRYPWFRFGIVDVEVMPSGHLLVVDNPSGWVYRLDSAYSLKDVIGERGFEPGKMQYPTFSHVDINGMILVSDTLNSRLQVFQADGRFHKTMGERGLGIGQFLRPKGVTVDSRGRIFVADSQLNVIQVFGAKGEFISLLGDERGLPLDIGSPNGIAFAEPDLIMICEKLSRRIQVRQILDTFASETVDEDEPEKGTSERRILAPVVTEPGSD